MGTVNNGSRRLLEEQDDLVVERHDVLQCQSSTQLFHV